MTAIEKCRKILSLIEKKINEERTPAKTVCTLVMDSLGYCYDEAQSGAEMVVDLAKHDKQHHKGHYDGKGTCKYRAKLVNEGKMSNEEAYKPTDFTKEMAAETATKTEKQAELKKEETTEKTIIPTTANESMETMSKQLSVQLSIYPDAIKDFPEGIEGYRKEIETTIGMMTIESATQEAVVKKLDEMSSQGNTFARELLQKLSELNTPISNTEKFNSLKEDVLGFGRKEGESDADFDKRIDDINKKLTSTNLHDLNDDQRKALQAAVDITNERIEQAEKGKQIEEPVNFNQDGLPEYIGADGKIYVDVTKVGFLRGLWESFKAIFNGKKVLDQISVLTGEYHKILKEHNTNNPVDNDYRSVIDTVAELSADDMAYKFMKDALNNPELIDEDRTELNLAMNAYTNATTDLQKLRAFSIFKEKYRDILPNVIDTTNIGSSKEFDAKTGDSWLGELPKAEDVFKNESLVIPQTDEEKDPETFKADLTKKIDDILSRPEFGLETRMGEIKIGPSAIKIELAMGADDSILGLTKNKELIARLNNALGTDTSTISQGEDGKVYLTYTRKTPAVVHLADAFKDFEVIEKALKMKIPQIIGKDSDGRWMVVDASKAPHILVGGTSGSGKSVDLRTGLLSAIMMKQPNELGVFIIDGKGNEFPAFKGLPHLVHPIVDGVSNPEKVKSSLLALRDEMHRRQVLLGKYGASNIDEYNEKNPNDKIKPIYGIIDEFKSLTDRDPSIQPIVDDILAQARSAGIHMKIATQSPNKTDMKNIMSNLAEKHIYKLKDSGAARAAGMPEAMELGGQGDGFFENNNISQTRMRGSIASNAAYGRAMKAYTGSVPYAFSKDVDKSNALTPKESSPQGMTQNNSTLNQPATQTMTNEESTGSQSEATASAEQNNNFVSAPSEQMKRDEIMSKYNPTSRTGDESLAQSRFVATMSALEKDRASGKISDDEFWEGHENALSRYNNQMAKIADKYAKSESQTAVGTNVSQTQQTTAQQTATPTNTPTEVSTPMQAQEVSQTQQSAESNPPKPITDADIFAARLRNNERALDELKRKFQSGEIKNNEDFDKEEARILNNIKKDRARYNQPEEKKQSETKNGNNEGGEHRIEGEPLGGVETTAGRESNETSTSALTSEETAAAERTRKREIAEDQRKYEKSQIEKRKNLSPYQKEMENDIIDYKINNDLARIDAEENPANTKDSVRTEWKGKPVAGAVKGVYRGDIKNREEMPREIMATAVKNMPKGWEIDVDDDGKVRTFPNGVAYARPVDGTNGSYGYVDKNGKFHYIVNTGHKDYKGVNSEEAKKAMIAIPKENRSNEKRFQEATRRFNNIAYGIDEYDTPEGNKEAL